MGGGGEGPQASKHETAPALRCGGGGQTSCARRRLSCPTAAQQLPGRHASAAPVPAAPGQPATGQLPGSCPSPGQRQRQQVILPRRPIDAPMHRNVGPQVHVQGPSRAWAWAWACCRLCLVLAGGVVVVIAQHRVHEAMQLQAVRLHPALAVRLACRRAGGRAGRRVGGCEGSAHRPRAGCPAGLQAGGRAHASTPSWADQVLGRSREPPWCTGLLGTTIAHWAVSGGQPPTHQSPPAASTRPALAAPAGPPGSSPPSPAAAGVPRPAATCGPGRCVRGGGGDYAVKLPGSSRPNPAAAGVPHPAAPCGPRGRGQRQPSDLVSRAAMRPL